jgi:hypothetical protein
MCDELSRNNQASDSPIGPSVSQPVKRLTIGSGVQPKTKDEKNHDQCAQRCWRYVGLLKSIMMGLQAFLLLVPDFAPSGSLAKADGYPGFNSQHSVCNVLPHRFRILGPAADIDKSELESSPMAENIQPGIIFPERLTFKMIFIISHFIRKMYS